MNKNTKLIITAIVATVAFVISYTTDFILTPFLGASMAGSWGIAVVSWIDDLIIKINTFDEIIIKRNYAYAILFLAYSIIFTGCFIATFMVYFKL